jgi:hypothetical protein
MKRMFFLIMVVIVGTMLKPAMSSQAQNQKDTTFNLFRVAEKEPSERTDGLDPVRMVSELLI